MQKHLAKEWGTPPWLIDWDDPTVQDWVGRVLRVGTIEARHTKKPTPT